eukprot:2372036-Rhodomonas_salina.1
MLRAWRKQAATASAKNTGNPTRSLEHLQQILFSTKAAEALKALADSSAAASSACEVQEAGCHLWFRAFWSSGLGLFH